MSGKPDGGPAFPHPALADEGFCPSYDMSGITARDYFAAKEPLEADTVTPAMAAALMGEPAPTGAMPLLGRSMWWAEAEARYKYMRADAMLKVRAEP